jgi:hypothetical protein
VSSSSSTAGLEWAHSTYPCPPSRRSAAPFTSVIYSKSRSSSIFSACHTKPGAAEDGTARLATLSGALIVLDYSRLNEPFKCRQPSRFPLIFSFSFSHHHQRFHSVGKKIRKLFKFSFWIIFLTPGSWWLLAAWLTPSPLNSLIPACEKMEKYPTGENLFSKSYVHSSVVRIRFDWWTRS